MSNDSKNQLKNGAIGKLLFLLIPLMIAAVLGGVIENYFLPERLELSYTKYDPAPFANRNSRNNKSAIKISPTNSNLIINGFPADNLYVYTIHISNTGNVALEGLTAEVLFVGASSDFQLYSSFHQNESHYGFQEFATNIATPNIYHIDYEYLNPGDSDIVSIYCNEDTEMSFYSHDPSLSIRELPPGELNTGHHIGFLQIFSIIVLLIVILQTAFLQMRIYKEIIDKKNQAP